MTETDSLITIHRADVFLQWVWRCPKCGNVKQAVLHRDVCDNCRAMVNISLSKWEIKSEIDKNTACWPGKLFCPDCRVEMRWQLDSPSIACPKCLQVFDAIPNFYSRRDGKAAEISFL